MSYEDGNPIEKTDNGWIFWEETWADFNGPYDTKEEAEEALKQYCEEFLGIYED